MKVLLINKFLYPKGGDAICTLATGDLLRRHGHEVVFWGMKHPLNPAYPHTAMFIDNMDLNNTAGVLKQLDIAGKILYSFEAREKLAALLRQDGRPDMVHLNNFAHQISPSILHVLKKHRIPAVMTMHDFKMVCAPHSLFSKGKVCTKCAGGNFYHCFQEQCVKMSRAKSLLSTVEMYLHHKLMHIYDHIHTFIAPSLFMKQALEGMGFRGRIAHIPNFIDCTRFEPRFDPAERSIVFFGRLSREKGAATLIEAAGGLDVQVKIIGDGGQKPELEAMVRQRNIKNVSFLGYLSGEPLRHEIRDSLFVVVPSEVPENNPLAVLEAFALGKPVLGARIGGIPELIREGVTGMAFESGNASDMRQKIRQMLGDLTALTRMGQDARRFVEDNFSAETYYGRLKAVYREAMGTMPKAS